MIPKHYTIITILEKGTMKGVETNVEKTKLMILIGKENVKVITKKVNIQHVETYRYLKSAAGRLGKWNRM